MSTPSLSHLSPSQRMAAFRAEAVKRLPYFGTGIRSLVPKEVPGLGTWGVTDESILIYDPDISKNWTAQEGAGVYVHEYMHVFSDHAGRFQKLIKAGVLTEADAPDWNQACDAEINDDLEAAGFTLPSIGGAQPITPKTLDLQPNRTAEEYIQIILQRKRKGKDGGGKQPPQSQPPQPKPGWGQCGSGAGNPLPDEPEGDPQGRTPIEQHIQRKATAQEVKEASKSRGNIPMGILRLADAIDEPAKVDWRDTLAHNVRNAVQVVRGTGDYTFTDRARMQSALEYTWGEDAPILPGEHQPLCEVALVIDTSGSMSDGQTKRALIECKEVLKNMGGARITFVSIDADVHACKQISSIEEAVANLKGGGGTDFLPAFVALDKFKPRPHVVIFATDGYGPAPAEAPQGMHVVWLIVDGVSPCNWGEHIVINSREDL